MIFIYIIYEKYIFATELYDIFVQLNCSNNEPVILVSPYADDGGTVVLLNDFSARLQAKPEILTNPIRFTASLLSSILL